MDKSQLKSKLSDMAYHVTQERGTEAPFSGQYVDTTDKGMYKCVVCGAELFSSDSKFESKAPGLAGWPSFSEAANNKALKLSEDQSLNMDRVEVSCVNCGAHLGHLFKNVPDHPTGVHYCINSCALDFEKK